MNTLSHDAYRAYLETLGQQALTSSLIAGLDAWFKETLPSDRQATILDFGCGLGVMLEYLHRRGYANVVGADINPALVSYSAKRLSAFAGTDANTKRPNPSPRIELIDNLAEYSCRHMVGFDCIILKDVIEHMPQDQVVDSLSLIRKMLKPDGLLIVSCPQICGFTSVFTLYNDFTHLRLFTERSLRQVLTAAGYSPIRLVHPCLSPTIRPTALALRFARAAWLLVIKAIFFIERPGETMPAYLGDRIMVVANKGSA